jgi:hypothetical protein
MPALSQLSIEARALIERRKSLFNQILGFVHYRGGHVTSVPGSSVIRFEAARDSSLPSDLRALGYKVVGAGATMRIDPIGKVEVHAGAHSSFPPVRTLTHATIDAVDIWEIPLGY